MKKIRYAIIGAGTMTREHIHNISIIKDAEVVAISDNHKQSIIKHLKIGPLGPMSPHMRPGAPGG